MMQKLFYRITIQVHYVHDVEVTLVLVSILTLTSKLDQADKLCFSQTFGVPACPTLVELFGFHCFG